MASRKEQKEELPLDQETSSPKKRHKITQLGLILLGAVVVIGGLILASQSFSGGKAERVRPPTQTLGLISSLPQEEVALGNPEAEISIVEYGDLQCPICKTASEKVIPEVIRSYVQTGQANLVFRNWIILGEDSTRAARASLAASEQGKHWQFIETFYANQGLEGTGYVTDDFLQAIAETIGLDIDQWKRDINRPEWDQQLFDAETQALSKELTGTPSFVVEQGEEEVVLPGLTTPDEIGEAIEELESKSDE
jgi:protein-disulfide isomerase